MATELFCVTGTPFDAVTEVSIPRNTVPALVLATTNPLRSGFEARMTVAPVPTETLL